MTIMNRSALGKRRRKWSDPFVRQFGVHESSSWDWRKQEDTPVRTADISAQTRNVMLPDYETGVTTTHMSRDIGCYELYDEWKNIITVGQVWYDPGPLWW
jgi:hypothetical protein